VTATLTLDELTVPAPPVGPADWNDEGVVTLHRFLDEQRIDDYRRCWEHENRCEGFDVDHGEPAILHAVRPGGWPDCTPYMRHPEILDLVAPLAPVLEELIGEPAGMHLNLTGWVSTERDWHQDSYLNEPEVGDRYAAVWIALGDVQHLDIADPAWPKRSEEILSPLFTAEIAARGAQPITYLPESGDVLIWHGRLLHRGSTPRVLGAYRPGFIAHFSGVHSRPAMGYAVEYPGGGFYFPISGGPV
jgi:ectoine hydroxylase-related dioxygenase (phytanoyl-CoA dioxygenase family)